MAKLPQIINDPGLEINSHSYNQIVALLEQMQTQLTEFNRVSGELQTKCEVKAKEVNSIDDELEYAEKVLDAFEQVAEYVITKCPGPNVVCDTIDPFYVELKQKKSVLLQKRISLRADLNDCINKHTQSISQRTKQTQIIDCLASYLREFEREQVYEFLRQYVFVFNKLKTTPNICWPSEIHGISKIVSDENFRVNVVEGTSPHEFDVRLTGLNLGMDIKVPKHICTKTKEEIKQMVVDSMQVLVTNSTQERCIKSPLDTQIEKLQAELTRLLSLKSRGLNA